MTYKTYLAWVQTLRGVTPYTRAEFDKLSTLHKFLLERQLA
jgi:hypothetical protein